MCHTFREDSSWNSGHNSFIQGICFRACLVVEGRDVQRSVPRGVLRGGVCPIKQQMLQVLCKTILASLEVIEVSTNCQNSKVKVKKVIHIRQ